MPRTVEGAVAWAKQHPTKDVGPVHANSWAGLCAGLVFWAGGFARSFDTALDAGDASGPLNSDWRAAPAGALHYWAGVGGNGHVAIDTGNDHTLLMASSQVSNFGNAVGTIRFADYRLPQYRGWSTRWGSETLAPSAPAPAATRTTPLPLRKKKPMFGFMRNKTTGEIAIIDGEHGTYRRLSFGEWASYAAADAKYADVDPAEYTKTLATLRPAA
ncbi:MAG TPA: hypothetical protein VFU07_07065 [Candidatus Lumbricidophila sp.]|nr:hypothetical protein [Candidatus Lumbricidophila sp.]